jgi:hypothetical protein
MNQRQRSWPLSLAGNRDWNWVARAGKIGIECGLVRFLINGLATFHYTPDAVRIHL